MCITKVLSWYEKKVDEECGSTVLIDMDIDKLRELFNLANSNPIYDVYEIKTIEQINYVSEFTTHKINLDLYDYFLEYN